MNMKNRYYFMLFLVFTIFQNVYSQRSVYNIYYLENVPQRSLLNPAYQPLSGFYLSLPVVGYSGYYVGSNDLNAAAISDDKFKLFNSLSKTTTIEAATTMNLLSFGFRKNANYYTFRINSRADVTTAMPRDFLRFALFGVNTSAFLTGNNNDSVFNFGTIREKARLYTEISLGYNRKVNEKFSIGGNLKYLHGTGILNAEFNEFNVLAGKKRWKIDADAQLLSSLPGTTTVGSTINSIKYKKPSNAMDFVKPAGVGFGIDIGATYKPLKNLELGVSLIDLGFIRWKTNASQTSLKATYDFASVNDPQSGGIFDGVDIVALVDSIKTDADSHFNVSNKSTSFTTYTTPKLNVSAEYTLVENLLSVGMLSSTAFYSDKAYEHLMASLNVRPINWFNMALSYNLTEWKNSSLGLGLGVRVGFVNFFVSTDFIPFTYSNYKLDKPLDLTNVPVINRKLYSLTLPDKANQFNFAVGLNFVFGNKQDKDKDGVRNSKDKCPDTPKGVKVDKFGCPIDSDKDGVPDYLDKCPGTVAEAGNFVDENGCPLDSDKDGVPDYMDKCPGTPAEAAGKVDSLGCVIDTDKDGVPDYMDKCPDTPAEEVAYVNGSGCISDTDGDGVPDYRDKCPNTPAAAIAFVDSVGCAKDSDGDGVADFMDKCPDTPKEAFGKVDSTGCVLDSDGDSIPDYLDKCPMVAGTRSNNGCPEVKKDVTMLMQKALQGIQFQSAKSVIKSTSYGLLNQIATSLIQNPDYLIEIQGHTDNVGHKESNMKLSHERANAVRKYLIARGVSEKRITANGYGDTMPLVPNTSAKNKSINRRVEFVISFDEQKPE